jgi:hypothetical protein
VVAALVVVTGPGGSGSSIVTSTRVQSGAAPSSSAGGAGPSIVRSSPATVTRSPSTGAGGAVSAAPAEAAGATSSAAVPAAPAGASAPGRVQQVSASLTLGTTPSNVQALSDQVGQLANRYGGYVQSSNVQVQQTGASEASLALRLPSARLGAELAAIGRLASVRAENQSLQDITDSYNSARGALSDAVAERQALLRALAAATSEGQIASLRERLSEARGAIARAQAAFNAVAHRASTAEVEVSILGDARAEPEGLTVHRGLRDAGHVLLVTATAILISAAVLVPLALVGMAVAGARRAVIRHRRERALDAP